MRPHGIEAVYFGWGGDGHIGRWNVSHQFYQARKDVDEWMRLAASVLAQPDTSYDVLIQVMDSVREAKPPGAKAKTPNIELFPDISIGDAPTSVVKK